MTESTVLPYRRDLTEDQLRFLEENFRTREDLGGKDLLLQSRLSTSYAAAENELGLLRNKLGKEVVSWMYGLEFVKRDVEKIKLDVEKLSMLTSPAQCGGYKFVQKMIEVDLRQIWKEMSVVKSLRDYVETTLRLEALVGDLEDVIFSIMNQRAGNVFSIGIATPLSGEYQSAHERLLKAVQIMHDIEEVLARSVNTRPRWSNLLKSVDSRVDKIISAIRSKVIADYRALLVSMRWPPKLSTANITVGEMSALPKQLLPLQPEKREAYCNSFLGLCVLQHLHSRREERKLKGGGQKHTYRVVWAIDELVSPIASQTEYHFSKWTSNQPKLIFALVYRITRDYIVEIDDALQPLVDKARLESYSAAEGWVFSMVQMLVGFLNRSVFPPLAEGYKVSNLKQEVMSMWIHLIDLMHMFDKQMLSLLSSEAGISKGVSRDISVFSVFETTPGLLKLWAKVELKDAWKILKSELTGENCWLNTSDTLSTGGQPDQHMHGSLQEYKAPSVAEFAIKVAWDMIERGKNLPNIALQVQFIRLTAGRFFWYYFKVLILRCKISELNKLGHDALPGVCASINAARFIESKLQEWSDDISFVEMANLETEIKAALPDSFSDKTRFFLEELKTLAELQTNGIMEIITDSLYQFEHLSSDFVHCKWNAHNEASLDKASISLNLDLSVSHAFIQALDFLRDRLIMLRDKLNPSNFLDLWRCMADGLDHFILNSILETGTQLSLTDAYQFDVDMKAVFLVFQPFCDRPEAFLPRIRCMLQLLKTDKAEAGRLLFGSNETQYSLKSFIPYLTKDQFEKIMKMIKY